MQDIGVPEICDLIESSGIEEFEITAAKWTKDYANPGSLPSSVKAIRKKLLGDLKSISSDDQQQQRSKFPEIEWDRIFGSLEDNYN